VFIERGRRGGERIAEPKTLLANRVVRKKPGTGVSTQGRGYYGAGKKPMPGEVRGGKAEGEGGGGKGIQKTGGKKVQKRRKKILPPLKKRHVEVTNDGKTKTRDWAKKTRHEGLGRRRKTKKNFKGTGRAKEKVKNCGCRGNAGVPDWGVGSREKRSRTRSNEKLG